jgi:hypothetical protein
MVGRGMEATVLESRPLRPSHTPNSPNQASKCRTYFPKMEIVHDGVNLCWRVSASNHVVRFRPLRDTTGNRASLHLRREGAFARCRKREAARRAADKYQPALIVLEWPWLIVERKCRWLVCRCRLRQTESLHKARAAELSRSIVASRKRSVRRDSNIGCHLIARH